MGFDLGRVVGMGMKCPDEFAGSAEESMLAVGLTTSALLLPLV